MARVAVFIVTLSAASNNAVTVSYATAPGTAVPPSDFTPTSGTITFLPGERVKQVIVPVRDDDQADEETFFLVLSSPSGAGTADDTGCCTLPAKTAPVVPVISIGSITI